MYALLGDNKINKIRRRVRIILNCLFCLFDFCVLFVFLELKNDMESGQNQPDIKKGAGFAPRIPAFELFSYMYCIPWNKNKYVNSWTNLQCKPTLINNKRTSTKILNRYKLHRWSTTKTNAAVFESMQNLTFNFNFSVILQVWKKNRTIVTIKTESL